MISETHPLQNMTSTHIQQNEVPKQLTDDGKSFHECIVQPDDSADAVPILAQAACIM